jgi:hypothetical protein
MTAQRHQWQNAPETWLSNRLNHNNSMSATALPVRRAPDSIAILLTIALCAVWGEKR